MAIASTSASKAPARRSSLPSEQVLFGGIYGRGATGAEIDDATWLQAMLDVEAALARACASEGLIPSGSADEIAAACISDRFDVTEIGAEGARHATPVVPLVAALRAAVREPARGYVHLGATS